jgi:hypothetical protein
MSKRFPVFSSEFKRRMSKRTAGDIEPSSASEADLAGPWRVIPLADGGHAVFRLGESPEEDDLPAATFADLEHALLAAAVLPGSGRDPLYRLGAEEAAQGFAVHGAGEIVGYLRLFNPDVTAALHVLGCVLRSPDSFARVLEAASGLTLDHADKILGEQARRGDEDPEDK